MQHDRPRDSQMTLFPEPEHETAEPQPLRELLRVTNRLRRAADFAALLTFLARHRRYSAFNGLLVWIQQPDAGYFAAARAWEKQFHRTVQPDGRPLLILAPSSPVAFVFDERNTDGAPLPDPLGEHPFFAKPELSLALFDRTAENCRRYRIDVRLAFEELPDNVRSRPGGTLTGLTSEERAKWTIELAPGANLARSYRALCRELGHLLLGHRGGDARDDWWPERTDLGHRAEQLEAATVAWLLAARRARHPELSVDELQLPDDPKELARLDLALVLKVVDLLERMADRKVEPGRVRG